MSYEILQNGQVLIVVDESGMITKTHFCMLEEQRKTRQENQYKIETLVFNPKTEVQEVTSTTFEPVPKEILLDELKAEYLPQIKDADMLGDYDEKARLQAEYLQKKAEIESL
jgi:hypothetical protein